MVKVFSCCCKGIMMMIMMTKVMMMKLIFKMIFADITSTTDSGATPLHLAASEGLLDCTEILVQAGADVLAQDSTGHTPLDLARIWCRREVAR